MLEQGLRLLEAQRPNLFLWAPVFLAIGIGCYFSLPFEPRLPVAGWIVLLSVPLALTYRARGIVQTMVFGAIFLAGLGVATGALRTALVAAPVLDAPMVATVEGRIVKRDISQTNRLRILLDNVVIYGLEPSDMPKKVRITLPGSADPDSFRGGMRIVVYARLSPPAPPVEAGGFDFRKYAWFRQIGGLGYALGPVLRAMEPARADAFGRIQAWRSDLSALLRDKIPGSAGGFAAAIVVGDRSAVDLESLENLRASNLAHLLAISGLHMGLLTGLVYAAMRFLMATMPRLALTHPIKSYAAAAAMLTGLLYLVFSGASIATQRAFVMAAVAYLAIIAGRPAITMRAVALAALIILLLRPESLTEAGFQMSFAATVGLVAVFGFLTERQWSWARPSRGIRIDRWFIGLVISSATAGLATAPFSAYHFNQIAQFGLIANLVAVPLMGLIVAPALVAGLILSLIGAGDPAFWIAGQGISGIEFVAKKVASLDGAVLRIPKGHSVVIPLLVLGALCVILLRGRPRLAGLGPVMLAGLLWSMGDRPKVLIDPSGQLIGILDNGLRSLNKSRGQGFAADTWLENDGDPADQKTAFARLSGMSEDAFVIAASGAVLPLPSTKASLARHCESGAIVVTTAKNAEAADAVSCVVINPDFTRLNGSVAIYVRDGKLDLVTANDVSGRRPWSMAAFGISQNQ